MLSASRAGSAWFASIWFLALLPALLSALICYIGDPDRTRSEVFYWWVPVILCGLVSAASIFFLREGVICLIMLAPIWMGSGWVGAFIMRSQRNRRGRSVQSSFLIIPLVAAMVEAQLPTPHETVVLTRSIVVHASPEDIWPYAVSSRGIGPDEGRWTITHNLIGMPRPRQSVVDKLGVGGVRTAYWGDHVNFEERIVEWVPGRKLGWRFNFTNSSVQDYTDRHISPDGEFLKVDSGDYTLRRIADGKTELTLTTRYIAKTRVNPYAKLWGELMMGDVQDNVLTVIKDRAERTAASRRRA
ncbi:SRPBCC family protein [Phenylobacterium sp.]|uniref:SRPBCC family protein n=1 Tax=Phenylobacterium sp. TaxID=1871053 RepID=UPI002C7D1DA5|nr:SRPBCC family protein [Phenylobacterium sp.]HVI34412.1 SRPBCC family protein [Phenylobacterium sp.]